MRGFERFRLRAGFTLLELLLALSILGLVFAITAGVMNGVLGGSQRVGAALGHDNLAGEIEEIIAGDLAFLAVVDDEAPLTARLETGSFSSLSFYSAAGSRTAWGRVVTPLHLVTYTVRPIGGGWGLFRGEKPLVETRDAYYDAPVLLAEGVTLFKVEGFDGKEWRDEWPAEGAPPLPLLTRVSMDIALPDGATRMLYVESAPAIEHGARPEEERRYSGGETGEDNSDADTPATRDNSATRDD